jgi:hypothetical protein
MLEHEVQHGAEQPIASEGYGLQDIEILRCEWQVSRSFERTHRAWGNMAPGDHAPVYRDRGSWRRVYLGIGTPYAPGTGEHDAHITGGTMLGSHRMWRLH